MLGRRIIWCAIALVIASLVPAVAWASHGPACSVEELPIDKFDEYPAGTLPPFPWIRIKPASPGADLTLKPDAESPFVGNLVTGKGLTMSVSADSGSKGDGIERRFNPAADGSEFLAFDFRIGAADKSRANLDLGCNLVDSKGRGVHIEIGSDVGLVVEQSSGKRAMCQIGPGQWYHLTVDIDPNKGAELALTSFPSKRPAVELCGLKLPSHGMFDLLQFCNCGDDKQQGTWSIDNVLMAGQVDATRNAWWPFDQAPLAKLRASSKKVFVYYFPIYTAGPTPEDPSLSWYSRTIMNPTLMNRPDRTDAGTEFEYCPYPRPPVGPAANAHEEHVRALEDEVRLARQLGIDGFFVDFEAYPSPYGGVYFNDMAFCFMEAAQRVDPGLKIIPAIYGPDRATPENARDYANNDIVKRALSEPNVCRLEDGRIVLTSWYPEQYSGSWWKSALEEMSKNGCNVAFVPQFNSIDHLKEFAPFSFAMANWGPRSPGRYDWVERVKPLGVKSVFPIVEQDVRTRGVWYMESCNSELLRGLWDQAIEHNADWAFIDTWSDYTEQAQEPSRAIGFAPFDLDAYYTQWFKTGRQPAIVRDALYYFYRIHHTSALPAHGKSWVLRKPWGDANETSPRDEIELLAFLKKPGVIRIGIGGSSFDKSAPAGITSFKVPLPAGKTFAPVFSLERDNRVVVRRAGLYSVLDRIEFGNMLYHSGVISPSEPEHDDADLVEVRPK